MECVWKLSTIWYISSDQCFLLIDILIYILQKLWILLLPTVDKPWKKVKMRMVVGTYI